LGAEAVVEIIEVTQTPMINSWLTSLKTTGLVIIALTVIIVVLAKTGVFNKILDWMITKKGLSTGFNKEVLKKFEDTLDKLITNDAQQNKQMTALEEKIDKNANAVQEVKAEIKEIKIESLKESVFNKGLPLIDRMAAGIRYLVAGCNSETENYLFTQLCYEDLAVWNGLCKVMNALEYLKIEKDRPENWKTESPRRN